jgi:hypothetical protein
MCSVEPTTKHQSIPINTNTCFAVKIDHCKLDSEDLSSIGFSTPSKDQVTSGKKIRRSYG